MAEPPPPSLRGPGAGTVPALPGPAAGRGPGTGPAAAAAALVPDLQSTTIHAGQGSVARARVPLSRPWRDFRLWGPFEANQTKVFDGFILQCLFVLIIVKIA